MTADWGSSPDNLDVAQRLMDNHPWSDLSPQAATALALIDIGRTLRDIRDEMHTMNLRGVPVRKI